jgi:hypothetical protein
MNSLSTMKMMKKMKVNNLMLRSVKKYDCCCCLCCFVFVFVLSLMKCVESGYQHEKQQQQQQQQQLKMTTTTLSQSRGLLASTSTNQLVFFGGGVLSLIPTSKASDRVDIYNVLSGSWSTTSLSIARE